MNSFLAQLKDDDKIRQIASRKLVESISELSDDSLSARETVWVTPGGLCKDMIPTVVDIPSGNVWRTLNHCRIMNQYCTSLCNLSSDNLFIWGDPATCEGAFEWFRCLNKPMHRLSDVYDINNERDNDSLAKLHAVVSSYPKGSCPAEQVYNTYTSLACPDSRMSRLMLGHEFPDSREYELLVCDIIMRGAMKLQGPVTTFLGWKQEFANWRNKGLYYVVAVAAKCMSSPLHWVPGYVREDLPVIKSLGTMLRSFTQFDANQHEAMDQFIRVFNRDDSNVPVFIAETLDRLAVLMRVKSNAREGENFCLDDRLATFPKSFGGDQHKSNLNAWYTMKNLIQDTYPPSLLIRRSKKASWGYPRVTLQYNPSSDVVCFAETELKWRGAAADPLPDPDTRIFDVLSRLSDVSTSKEVAACMVNPKKVTEIVESMKIGQAVHGNPVAPVMTDSDGRRAAALSEMGKYWMSKDVEFLGLFKGCMQTLEGCAPAVRETVFDKQQTVVMWRVDLPQRGIVYTGGDLHEMLKITPSRHHLSKSMTNTRLTERMVSNIHHLGYREGVPPVDETIMLRAMASFSKQHLQLPKHNVIMTKRNTPSSQVTLTTLPEAMSCFVLHPPSQRNVTPLGASSPWEDNAIDHRYSELQKGSNGFRLRDWAAMHVDASGTHQARLAGHALEYKKLYTTLLPWFKTDADMTWVKMTATQPPTNLVLQGATLRQAVESRYFHDTRMLPLSSRETHQVTRKNCEIYSSGDAGSVAIGYTATPIHGNATEESSVVDVALFEDCMSSDIKTPNS